MCYSIRCNIEFNKRMLSDWFFAALQTSRNTVDIHPADPNINSCARIGASPTSTSRERGGTGRSGGSGVI